MLTQIAIPVFLLVLGPYLVYQGTKDKIEPGATLGILFGAMCVTFGVLALIRAVKSVMWRREMIRYLTPDQEANRGDSLGQHLE